MKSGLMCLIVRGMKHNSHNVPSLHGVELNVLIDEMLESSAQVNILHSRSDIYCFFITLIKVFSVSSHLHIRYEVFLYVHELTFSILVTFQNFSSDSSLALHDGRVRLSGERECEGEVEVYIHQVWRRVLLDSWSVTESSVVCRQLGCDSVLNFYSSSSSSPEHSHECVMGFQCSGSEAHLGNCSSPQTLNCSSTQQLSITCLSENNNIWTFSFSDNRLI